MIKLKPFESADKQARRIRPQNAILLAAIVVAVAGLAPVGLVALFRDVTLIYDLDGAGALIGVFWVILLLAAGYSLYTKNTRHAAVILAVICAMAVLNLGGCALEFARVGKALG